MKIFKLLKQSNNILKNNNQGTKPASNEIRRQKRKGNNQRSWKQEVIVINFKKLGGNY